MNYKQLLQDNRDNTDLLCELAQQVNSYDGALDHLKVYEFDDDFFEVYFEGKPEDVARAVFFGDIRNWSDDYIRFNGYGNLESLDEYQYEKELADNADDIITEALRLADEIELDSILESHGIEIEEVTA